MPDSGWRRAALAVSDNRNGGDFPWVNPGNVTTAENSASATAGLQPDQTEYLLATAPSDMVPPGAIVLGIEFRARALETRGSTDFSRVRAVKNDVIGSKDLADDPASISGSGPYTFVFGSPTELWDTTWTAAEVNGGLGVALEITIRFFELAYLYEVEFKVTYEAFGGLQTGRGGGRPQMPELSAGSRFTGLSGSGQGVNKALFQIGDSGRWLSPGYVLDPLRLALKSSIAWDETLPADTLVVVESRLGGADWATCSNGAEIPNLMGEDIAGRNLEIRVTLLTNDVAQTPRFGNLVITAEGALGLTEGFYRNPATGHLIPKSTKLASEQGWETFDRFVADVVDCATYDSPDIDIGFDDRARSWASNLAADGPGESGESEIRRYWAWAMDGEAFSAFEPLTIGDEIFRYARFRIQIKPQPAVSYLRQFTPTVDLLERRETENLTVAAGGSDITFDPPFHRTPGVEVTPEAPAGSLRIGGWENLTTMSVRVHVFNSAGVSVGGLATVTITGV